MKFLAKDPSSRILADALVYKLGAHNDRLLALLRDEQHDFCAYTEKRLSPLDTCAVEHFDPGLKNTAQDGYHNYYATLQSANQRKRRNERAHRDASCFTDRFFQAPGGFERRIRYIAGEYIYEEIDPSDDAARSLITYLGLNDHEVLEERRKHVARLRDIFSINAAQWAPEQRLSFLRSHPAELSYPTALAAELQLHLDSLL